MIRTEDFAPAEAVYAAVASAAIEQRLVSIPFPSLATRTGLDPFAIEVGLDQLGMAGLVACWDPGPGPSATLTPLAAARLGLKLRRLTGKRGGLTWVPLRSPDPKVRRAPLRSQVETNLDVRLDELPGSSLRPDQIAEAAEDLARSAPRSDRRLSDDQATRLPRPAVVLTGCRAWPDGWWHDEDGWDGKCPACRGLRMRPGEYCLVCDRWGLDWLLDRLLSMEARSEANRAQPVPAQFRPAGAAVGA